MPSDAIWAWSIIVAATAGVIIRPFRLPEAIWAVHRRRRPGAARLAAVAGCAHGHRERRRRLSVPDRHDADRRAGPARRPVRLSRRARGRICRRLAAAAVPADLHRRHGRHRAALERRHRDRADARRLCRDARGRRQAAALSVRLRLHRQRRKLRAADLQPRQSRRVRRAHAAADRMAAPVRPALGRPRSC